MQPKNQHSPNLLLLTTPLFIFLLNTNFIALKGVQASQNTAGVGKGATRGSNFNPHRQCPFFDGIYTSVMRRIFNQGFHKDLSTEIELMWTTSILPENCRLVIEETLPRGMYVDLDQLRDLSEMNILHTYVPASSADVDVEKPEFESQAFRVMVFRKLAIQVQYFKAFFTSVWLLWLTVFS